MSILKTFTLVLEARKDVERFFKFVGRGIKKVGKKIKGVFRKKNINKASDDKDTSKIENTINNL